MEAKRSSVVTLAVWRMGSGEIETLWDKISADAVSSHCLYKLGLVFETLHSHPTFQ